MNEPNHYRNWHSRAFVGLHYDLHAGLKDTELGAALTHEHLRAELLKVRPDVVQCDCKGHPGITSWPTEVGTPSPGIVRDALRIHRDVTRELAIPLVMHYSGVWDNQAIALHPDWAVVGPSGEVAGKEGFVTGATCNLSPYTAELMIPQLLELIDKYDVDGFWVDGENWATRPCYCDRCREAFLQETGIESPPNAPGDAHWDQWAAFHRRNFDEHVRLYTDAVHARKPECTVCSNWMYSFGQPEEIDVPIDYLSGDFTWKWSLPNAHQEGRFMDGRRLNNPGVSWDLMAWGFTSGEDHMGGWTFKTAAGLCQEAGAVIALGGCFLIYSSPQRNGHLNGWQQDILAEVARFVRARQPWCQDTETASEGAVLHNAAHFYEKTGEVLLADWKGSGKPIAGALHALLENHVSTDVVNAETLLEHLSRYRLVVIPEQTHVSNSLRTALAEWVREGGRLLLAGAETVRGFAVLAGIEPAGEERPGFFSVQVGREVTTVRGPWMPVSTSGASVLTHILKGPDPAFNEADLPAVTVNRVGEGLVAAIPGPLFSHFADTHYPRTRALIGETLSALNPGFSIEMEGPARVHLVARRKENLLLAHLVNTGSGHPLAPSAVIVEDVPRVGPLKVRFHLDHRPRAIYLAPSQDVLRWDFADGVATVHVDSIGTMESVVVELA